MELYSAAQLHGASLNNAQFFGPYLQQKLISVFFLFRQHPLLNLSTLGRMFREGGVSTAVYKVVVHQKLNH